MKMREKTKEERVTDFKHDWKIIEDAYAELKKANRPVGGKVKEIADSIDKSMMSRQRETILRFFELTEEDVK